MCVCKWICRGVQEYVCCFYIWVYMDMYSSIKCIIKEVWEGQIILINDKIKIEGFLDGDKRVSFLIFQENWNIQPSYDQRSVDNGTVFWSTLVSGCSCESWVFPRKPRAVYIQRSNCKLNEGVIWLVIIALTVGLGLFSARRPHW